MPLYQPTTPLDSIHNRLRTFPEGLTAIHLPHGDVYSLDTYEPTVQNAESEDIFHPPNTYR